MVYSAGGRARDQVGWERRYLSRLSGTLVDGAVLVTPTVVDLRYGAPVVAVDPHTGPGGRPTVDSDNLSGAHAATEHLLSLGHRRIAMLTGRPDLLSAQLREQGFRQAMAAAGVVVDEDLVRLGSHDPDAAAEQAELLLAGPDRPTAVFAANDLSAIATMDVARRLGLRVPRDLSVVGFTDPRRVRTGDDPHHAPDPPGGQGVDGGARAGSLTGADPDVVHIRAVHARPKNPVLRIFVMPSRRDGVSRLPPPPIRYPF